MTHKFDSVIHDLADCKNLCEYMYVVTFGLPITTYTYWALAGEKGRIFRQSKMLFEPKVTYLIF